jgi:hypothetical protein
MKPLLIVPAALTMALTPLVPPAGGQSVVPSGGGFVYVNPAAFAKDFAAGVPPSFAALIEKAAQAAK